MQEDFWHDRWKKGEIGFHRQEAHPYLKQFAAATFAPNSNILVPLCGKTLDMIYLAQQGHHILGVELSPLAVEQFFIEQKLTKMSGPVANSWQASELPVTLFCGDFFNIPTELTGDINAVYDRAAIIALPKDMRSNYCNVIKQLAKNKTLNYLLIAIEFDNSDIGPPFSVPQSEIAQHYGQTFSIQLSRSEKFETTLPHHRAIGITAFNEYCLQLKSF